MIPNLKRLAEAMGLEYRYVIHQDYLSPYNDLKYYYMHEIGNVAMRQENRSDYDMYMEFLNMMRAEHGANTIDLALVLIQQSE